MKSKNKRVYGVGINDANYKVHLTEWVDGIQNTVWTCPFYVKWVSMLARCYSSAFIIKSPSYSGCSVAPEWHVFSCFRQWMEQHDWQGKDLDKDLISQGNKVYGPEHCLFVSRDTNTFILECNSSRGIWPIGVSFNKARGRFMSRCQDVTTKKVRFLGWFESPEDAHQEWLSFKRKQAIILASQQADPVIAQHLIRRYENYGARL